MKKLLPLLMAFSMSACVLKDVQNTANDMNRKMDSTNDNTEKLNQVSGNIYEQTRSKEAQDTRIKSWKNLSETKSLKKKIALAGHYFAAFEFQLWTGEGKDTKEYRQALFTSGAKEFALFYSSLEDSDTLSKMALAMALHKTHEVQPSNASENGFEAESMLSLLKKALIAEAQGQELSEYQLEFLYEREKMIELLKTRMSVFAANAANGAATVDVQGNQVWAFPMAKEYNQKRLIGQLQFAMEIKRLFAEIGETFEIDPQVEAAFKNLPTLLQGQGRDASIYAQAYVKMAQAYINQ